jgi:hypothetical protein
VLATPTGTLSDTVEQRAGAGRPGVRPPKPEREFSAVSALGARGLETGGRLLQELDFLRGAAAPEDGVAVRVAAEAIDDRLVA